MKNWKYKMLEVSYEDSMWSAEVDGKNMKYQTLEPFLNELGIKGWELVNVQYVPGNQYAKTKYLAWFKEELKPRNISETQIP